MGTLSYQRSAALAKSLGYDICPGQHWNQWTHQRVDDYHMVDLWMLKADVNGMTAVQATGEDVQSHIAKLLEGYTDTKGKSWPPNPYLPKFLRAGNHFFIWAWRKRGERGKRKTWELRELEFVLKDGIVVAQETGAKNE